MRCDSRFTFVKASVLPALAILALGGCHADADSSQATSRAALTEARRVTFTLPAGIDFATVAVGANGTLKIDDHAQILTTAAGFAPTTNAGTATGTLSDYGVDSRVGTITSNAGVSLHDTARVTGSVTSGKTVTVGSNVVITGTTTQNAVLTPVQQLSWDLTFQLGTQDVTAPVGGAKTVTPGAYRNVTAFGNSTLTLNGAGTYYFDTLDLEATSRLAMTVPAGGSVTIYVRTTLIWRPTSATGLPAENLLVAYLGTTDPAFDTSFNGTLIVPSAKARLGVGSGTHSGVLLARDVELDPSVRYTFRPYAKWDQIAFNVIPTLSCVEQRPQDQRYAALLGYYNPNKTTVTVPVGASNGFSPAPQGHGQPTTFLPGRFPADFGIDFGSATSLTWQLQGTSLALARTSTACVRSIASTTTADTTVASATPKANFGSATTLTVGPGSHALVRFDRAAIRAQIGTGRTVQKATLELTFASGAKPTLETFMMSRGVWTEAGATWSCADDTDPSATGETCAAGRAWQMTRDPDAEAAETVPWRPRTSPANGVWSGNKVTFDVTHDAWDLLGGEGVRRGMSFIVVATPDATSAAQLGSLESASKPRLLLDLTTVPEAASGGEPPLSIAVDPTVLPRRPESVIAPDGTHRPFVGVVNSDGETGSFVDHELLVEVPTTAALNAIVARWNGKVVQSTTTPGLPDSGILAEISVDTSRANTSAVVERIRQLDNRESGPYRVTSASALATIAIAVEEELLYGTPMSLNWGTIPSLPSQSDWNDRNIHDGEPDMGFEKTPVPGSNPFAWPGFASCDPYEPDPSGMPGTFACATTFPDGNNIFEMFTVADAWRALAFSGHLVEASVPVGLADIGYLPDGIDEPEYPPFLDNWAINHSMATVANDGAPFHGDAMVRIGFGRAGNANGGAGPGGPVADLESLTSTYDDQFELAEGLRYLRLQKRVVSCSQSLPIPAFKTIFTGVDTDGAGSSTPLLASAGNLSMDVDHERCLDGGKLGGIGCRETTSVEPCENDGVICVGGFDYNSVVPKTGPKGNGTDVGSKGSVDFAGPWYAFAGPWVDGFTLPPAAPPTTFHVTAGGTSGATAFLAGITSLIAAANPAATGPQISRCLFAGGTSVGFQKGNTRWPDALKSVRCMLGGASDSNVPANIEIIEPDDGITVAAGQLVEVMARATDYEAGALLVDWSSDIEGGLGETFSEQPGFVIFKTPGDHVLTASAVGEYPVPPGLHIPPITPTPEPVSASITVHVGPPIFDVSIVKPASDGATFNETTAVTFAASATSFGIAPPDPSTFSWSSVRDSDGSVDFSGAIGVSISKAFSTDGTHTVTVTRTDPGTGETVSASRSITILATTTRKLDIVLPPLDPSTGVAEISSSDVTLEATANFDVMTYDWSVIIGSKQFEIGLGNDISWNPYTMVARTCNTLYGTLRLRLTSTDGITYFDSQPLRIASEPTWYSAHCIK